MNKNFVSIILAAGMGTRMKSEMPKVLHKVCGKALCEYPIEVSEKAGAEEVVVVVGHKAEMVKEYLGDRVKYALQQQQLGTGHAVMQALDFLKGKRGYVIILGGDTPLITEETVKRAIAEHESLKNSATVITAQLPDPYGYGRIIRNADGGVVKIVEQKDANKEEAKVKEVNSGMYVFNIDSLIGALSLITNNNAQGEYYLTDTLEILIKKGERVGAYVLENPYEMSGVNDRVQLAQVNKMLQARIVEGHMRSGVTIYNPETIYIESDVVIGRDTVIFPNVTITQKSKIGKNVVIGMNSQIVNSTIEDGVEINCSVITDSHVCKDAKIGPFAYLRPNSKIGDHVKIGDFVEIKNSTLGEGTKVAHLTYIGDAKVGKNVNFGCGTVTVNYDGKKKYVTEIGDNAFIGCNTNLVSPVTVKKNAYIAAGSTITDEVPENALAIARSRQVNKLSWKDKRDNK